MTMHRTNDLIRFYRLLDRLRTGLGVRYLHKCDGKMEWPDRGVYFFFENGEVRSGSGEGPRVVRAGTHAVAKGAKTTLWNRLTNHRGSMKTGGGNHGGSVFRLLVGEAAMRREPSYRVAGWAKEPIPDENAAVLELERRVSCVIRGMPFLWLEVDDAPGPDSARANIERNAIALLSEFERDAVDPASAGWLGRHSAALKVRESGLWNRNHVDESHDPRFLDEFERLVDAFVGKGNDSC